MVNIALDWQQAAVLSAGLLAAGIALRAAPRERARRLAPFVREGGIIAALYALWQFAGSATFVSTGGAFARGRWILRVEQDLHLPSELHLQHLITPHPLLAQACNLYYAAMHFAALFALLLWLFVRHRGQYARWRTTVAVSTALCLVVQFVPVAPPRLLGAGFVDVAAQYGQSVYVVLKAVGPDQLSAMPSVHVGWAVLVALAVIRTSTSRWRWLVLAHPVLTVFVVTATANHYWLDGVVAIALLAVAIALQAATRRLVARLRAGRTAPAAEPVPAGLVAD